MGGQPGRAIEDVDEWEDNIVHIIVHCSDGFVFIFQPGCPTFETLKHILPAWRRW